MPCQHEELRRVLLAMAADDKQMRENLLERGVLYDGYHQRIFLQAR
jgi:hypothetical protein